MSRIRRGWELTKKSWGVLRANPDLFRFPIYGAAATIPVAIITLGPGFYLLEENVTAGAIAVIAVGLFILAFIGIYFSVGLAACADKIFRGEQATVRDGLAVARENLGPIAGWALLSTIVGTIFNLLESQGTLGQIAGRLLDIGWALVTFLAVPVIAIEGTGPIETLKRSASLFKSRWGQQVTGNLAIGGAVVLFGMLPAVAADRRRRAALELDRLRRRDPRDHRRDRLPDRDADPEGDDRRLRSRPLPLRRRRQGNRRLHRRRAGLSREEQGRGGRTSGPAPTPASTPAPPHRRRLRRAPYFSSHSRYSSVK